MNIGNRQKAERSAKKGDGYASRGRTETLNTGWELKKFKKRNTNETPVFRLFHFVKCLACRRQKNIKKHLKIVALVL